MTTSHVIEGLLRCWGRGNRRAGALAADMLTRFVRMMFTGGDPAAPTATSTTIHTRAAPACFAGSTTISIPGCWT